MTSKKNYDFYFAIQNSQRRIMMSDGILGQLYTMTRAGWSSDCYQRIVNLKSSNSQIMISECKHFLASKFSQSVCKSIANLVTIKKISSADFSYFKSRVQEIGTLFYLFALLRLYYSIPTACNEISVNNNFVREVSTYVIGYDTNIRDEIDGNSFPLMSSWNDVREFFLIRESGDDDLSSMFGSQKSNVRQIPVSTIPEYRGAGHEEISKRHAKVGIGKEDLVGLLEKIDQVIFSDQSRKPMCSIMSECFGITGEIVECFSILQELVSDIDPVNARKSGVLHVFGYSFLFPTPKLKELCSLAGDKLSKSIFGVNEYGDGFDVLLKYGQDEKLLPSVVEPIDIEKMRHFVWLISSRKNNVSQIIDSLSNEYHRLEKMKKSEDSTKQFQNLVKHFSSISSQLKTDKPAVATDAGGYNFGAGTEDVIDETTNIVIKPGRAPLEYNIFRLLHDNLARCGRAAGNYAATFKPSGKLDEESYKFEDYFQKMHGAETLPTVAQTTLDIFGKVSDGTGTVTKDYSIFNSAAKLVIRTCFAPEIASLFIETVEDILSVSYRTNRKIKDEFGLEDPQCRRVFRDAMRIKWRQRDAINHNRANGYAITAKLLEAELETAAKIPDIFQTDAPSGFIHGIKSRIPTQHMKGLKKEAFKQVYKRFGRVSEAFKNIVAQPNASQNQRSLYDDEGPKELDVFKRDGN